VKDERVTIALGIIGSASGVVLAADTEMSWGNGLGTIKTADTRSFNPSRDKTHAMGLCGVGNGDYFQAISLQLVEDILDQNDWTYESVANLIETRLLDFYPKHVIPLQGCQDHPNIELLIGLNSTGKCALWGTSSTTVRPCIGYEAIGAGRAYAQALLSRLHHPLMDVKSSIALAAYVVFCVKEFIGGCGKNTQVVALREGRSYRIPPLAIKRLEDLTIGYLGDEARVCRYALGSPTDPDCRDAIRNLHRLRKQMASLDLLEERNLALGATTHHH
jgi:hypothetical protein